MDLEHHRHVGAHHWKFASQQHVRADAMLVAVGGMFAEVHLGFMHPLDRLLTSMALLGV
jgi:hypothetical protein